MMSPIAIHGLTALELQRAARQRLSRGHGAARAIYGQLMREGRFAPEEHGLGRQAVGAWREHFHACWPETARVVDEPGALGPTRKLTLRLRDGLEYETVALPMGRGRHTLCVSTQVGCKMRCGFCETGRMGLLRDLSADEIVAQLLIARFRLGWRFRNVVFMGMGEALDNFDNLVRTLDILCDPRGMAMGRPRLTVCTVGDAAGIRRLAELGLSRLNLAVSLNAANDELRSQLMPINRRVPLAELQAALVAYRPRANFMFSINYCLLPGINDHREHAREVARFCEPLGRVMLHVIPYNPGSEPLARPPSDEEVARFVSWLRSDGLMVRRRITKGQRVMAACGQLGNPGLRVAHRRRRLAQVPGERPPG